MLAYEKGSKTVKNVTSHLNVCPCVTILFFFWLFQKRHIRKNSHLSHQDLPVPVLRDIIPVEK